MLSRAAPRVHTVVVPISRDPSGMDLVVRIGLIGLVCLAGAVLAACGADRSIEAAATLPSSGTAYRALDVDQRAAVAAGCRDRVAATSSGEAARQLRSVDPFALRSELDDAFTFIAAQHRSVADVCAEVVPFVTPGLDVSIDGAKEGGDGSFSYETTSDKLLTIRGRISPAPGGGRVVARRALGSSAAHAAAIQADGRFAIAPLHLRKISENTFTLTIAASPNAPRKVHFSAICLDCLAGATRTLPQQ
jgi:hypothetical protein